MLPKPQDAAEAGDTGLCCALTNGERRKQAIDTYKAVTKLLKESRRKDIVCFLSVRGSINRAPNTIIDAEYLGFSNRQRGSALALIQTFRWEAVQIHRYPFMVQRRFFERIMRK
jgi:hypothetical protein